VDPLLPVIVGVFLLIALFLGAQILLGRLGQKKIEDIQAMIARGRFRDALRELEAILEKDERNPLVNFLLGNVHEKMGGYQAAILQYRRILKFGRWRDDVTELKVRRHLAECLRHAGNHTEAKNEYLILTKLDPQNFEYFYEVARLFQKGKVYPNALKFYKQAVALNSHHFESWSGLGRTYFAMNAYSDAKDALSRAAELDPANRENLYYLGQAYRFLGEHSRALEYFEKSERDESLRTRSILAKGLVLIDQGSYAQAMTELERGLAWAETGSEIWLQFHYLIAACAERLKDVGVAIEHWELIQKHDPKYRDVASKLKQYAEFRTNDQIKELLIASRIQFETLARSIAGNMGLRILSSRMHNDIAITLVCSENQGAQKLRAQNTLVRIYREMGAISENQIREFHDLMKSENAAKGIFMTVGEFSPSAMEYAANRPIELVDGAAMIPVIQGAVH
jgi:tetratricopeptide (TPR) repeat protein